MALVVCREAPASPPLCWRPAPMHPTPPTWPSGLLKIFSSQHLLPSPTTLCLLLAPLPRLQLPGTGACSPRLSMTFPMPRHCRFPVNVYTEINTCLTHTLFCFSFNRPPMFDRWKAIIFPRGIIYRVVAESVGSGVGSLGPAMFCGAQAKLLGPPEPRCSSPVNRDRGDQSYHLLNTRQKRLWALGIHSFS